MTQKISKSKLKAKMLEIFRNIEATGEDVIVTDHGKPVLRIVAIKKKKAVIDLFGDLQGQVVYHEDIDTPTVDEWSEF
jgi:antitoxin (DNA-binding transcriptional repressor) of toxin-antitoxin stability system